MASTSAANLSFQVWQNSESGKDKFYVLTSLDDNYYYGWSYSGYSSGWVNLTFDLTNWGSLGNLTGQPNVWLAFVFLTDSANTYAEGVYVDNVVLNASYPGTSAPSLAEQPKVDIPEGWIASSEQLHRQLTPQGQR